MAIPSASTALSISAPSSSIGGVNLEAIMAQLVCMDARLDTLSDELCQVNTRVGRIARCQAAMGGYTADSSLSPPAFTDEDDDGDVDASNAKDDDASSFNVDAMST